VNRTARRKQRERLLQLTEWFYNVCLAIGYLVGVVGITLVLRELGYSWWFGIPLAIVGGIPIGIPLGGIPGLLLKCLFFGLIDLFYADVRPSKTEDESGTIDTTPG
jgi:hypothetical protein